MRITLFFVFPLAMTGRNRKRIEINIRSFARSVSSSPHLLLSTSVLILLFPLICASIGSSTLLIHEPYNSVLEDCSIGYPQALATALIVSTAPAVRVKLNFLIMELSRFQIWFERHSRKCIIADLVAVWQRSFDFSSTH